MTGEQRASDRVDLASCGLWPTIEDVIWAHGQTTIPEEAERLAWRSTVDRYTLWSTSLLGRRAFGE